MICNYGCELKATHQFKNGKWCCSTHFRKCPAQKRLLIKFHIGKKRSIQTIQKIKEVQQLISKRKKEKKNKEYQKNISLIGIKLCSYCDSISKHFFPITKTWCCKDHWSKCKANKKRMADRIKGIKVKTNKFCEYGCNQIAKYKFKSNEKYCCSKYLQSCPVIKKKNTKSNRTNQRKHSLVYPNYNPIGCKAIDKYGKKHNYNFQHAENGGEYNIKELGYWVDGYDKEKNVVIEFDERFHYDYNGVLKEKDLIRQQEIEEFLNCKFIRIKENK